LTTIDRNKLNSISDSDIDIESEIEKRKKPMDVLDKIEHLKTSDEKLQENIGRYVKFKQEVLDKGKRGLIDEMGAIYEIVGIQKHHGYIDGAYSSNKIGYRIMIIGDAFGRAGSFGKVGDVDSIEFINISEDKAIEINNEISLKLR